MKKKMKMKKQNEKHEGLYIASCENDYVVVNGHNL
jgi:hypothetical protein